MSDAEARAEHGYAQTEAMLALEGGLQARQDEIERLRAALETCTRSHQRMNADYERAVHLLVEYGRHQEGCNAQWGDGYRCRCGWREVEAEFGVRGAQEPGSPPPASR
jgi:hypothetical protein